MNNIHGRSTLRVAPILKQSATDALLAKFAADPMSADFGNDKNFEVVYVAREVFDDGYSHVKVCFRLTHPDRLTSKRNTGPETITLIEII